MRLLLQTTAACMMLLVATPTMAQECAAIRTACTDQCFNRAGAAGQQPLVTGAIDARTQACINRCSIASCQQTPLGARLCDATAQRICNNGFQGCTDACIPSTAATAADVQSQNACTTSCCSNLKACLAQRQCDLPTITAINCQAP